MEWRSHIARYGQRWWPGEPWVRWTLLLLLTLSGVLRSWDMFDIPFTHDELSALVRVYPTLSETIQRGVIELDTHPPGVQVFEWAWTKLFGMSAFAVKMPFLIMSMVALFLLFRFALAWTSAPTAIVTIALLSCIQFTVMYAQIARPYAFGLFTTALLADQLTRFLAFHRRVNLVMVGVAAVLSAYSHHFTLLLAGIMVLTGLLIVRPDQRRTYLVMCFSTVVAYVPNLPIFLKQLSLGGLSGWLRPPGPTWLFEFGAWLLHFSPLFALVVLALAVVALRSRYKGTRAAGPARSFLLIWGLAPIVIGLAYSVWRAPVIQYSMALFSFPYLVIAFLAGLGSLGRLHALCATALIALVGTGTLIRDRHHYELFYTSKYDLAVERGGELMFSEFGPARTLLLMDMPDPQVRFAVEHGPQWSNALKYVNIREMDASAVDSVIRSSSAAVVLLGISNGNRSANVAQVQAYFPFLIERHDVVEGQVFVFARKQAERTVSDRNMLAHASPEGHVGGAWDIHVDLPVLGETGKREWDLNGREYGVACEVTLDHGSVEDGALFEVVAEVLAPTGTTDAAVVLELHTGDSLVTYTTGEISGLPSDKVVQLVAAGTLDHVPHPRSTVRIKAYIHDRLKGALRVRNMKVYQREANPVRYWPITKVERMPRTR
ncbi:MAG: glycosyltransferase family 39 protein [Flavobacteriales bacterium]|nr:glycosyltransferase family 39 protein [Flavobacteriales bacterium]